MHVIMKVPSYLVHILSDVHSIDEGGSLGGGEEPGDDAQSGGLAGPVVPQERRDLVLVEVDRQLVHSQLIARRVDLKRHNSNFRS